METSDNCKGRLRIHGSISCAPAAILLHLVGWRGDAEVATAFTAAPLIGTALALEVQAIASPAAMVRKKSVLRMNVSPEVHETNGAPFQFHLRSAATEKGRAPLADRRRPKWLDGSVKR